MYRYLEGKLAIKEVTQAVLDVAGIGYEIFIPLSTYRQLPQTGAPVRLWIHLVVREDAHLLFGFSTEEERDVFRLLMTVSGIGPKLALTVLSGIGIQELKEAVSQERTEILTAISGIGRKTAERMIVELKEKIIFEDKSGKKKISGRSLGASGLFETGLAALTQLGYKKQEASDVIRKVIARHGEEIPVDQLVRESLKSF
ncbi:MAG: Holliday junction branch migration protein RuvA [Candidatus Omnitrophica bacterium]|nr:Holliday junction branch migration protein RuvA [Candidatus Omnitrophota bacterium]